MTTAYLALDVHAASCTLGLMDGGGTYVKDWRFPTAESELIPRIAGIEVKSKVLALEECTLAAWVARTLEGYVDEIYVCDPRKNALISRSARKSDRADVYNLCRLLRLNELNEVYHPTEDHRAVFKAAAQHYLDMRKQQVALKNKIKSAFRRWGVLDIEGARIYHSDGRNAYLSRLTHQGIESQLRNLYQILDAALAAQKEAKKQLLRLGGRYPEIKQFQKMPGIGMPGIGPIGSHLFDAFIQTPHRFKTKQKLWRYCQLGIRSRSSDGKPLGYEELDPTGRSELKTVSYRAWLSAMGTENEVRTFYEQSLARTKNDTHARLNTQRKILATLYSLWKNQSAYKPDKFLGSQ